MRSVLIGTGHFQLCRVAGGCWVAVGGFGTTALWCTRWPLPGEPWGSEPGVLWRAAFAVIGDFLPLQFPSALQKTAQILHFLKLQRMDFPAPMHCCFHRFWPLDDCCRHVWKMLLVLQASLKP